MAHTKNFFEKQFPHSKVKSNLVAGYIVPWASIVWPNVRKHGGKRLLYMDFFSGPGRFDDGGTSTPLMVLDKTDEILRDGTPLKNILATRFYESVVKFSDCLKRNLGSHPKASKLRYEPKVRQVKLTAEKINRIVSRVPVGTLVFIDPFDNTSLSARLFSLATQKWGCDCLSYVSVTGITRNVQKDKMPEYLSELFEEKILSNLKTSLKKCKNSDYADELVMDALRRSVQLHSSRYLVWLFMETDKSTATSYALVFISKDPLGFKIMRDMMVKEEICRRDDDDLPMFRYGEKSKSLERVQKTQTSLELKTWGPRMVKLVDDIANDFRGKTLPFENVIELCRAKGYIYTDSNIRKGVKILIENDRAYLPDYRREEKRKCEFTKRDRISFRP